MIKMWIFNSYACTPAHFLTKKETDNNLLAFDQITNLSLFWPSGLNFFFKNPLKIRGVF